MNRAKPPIHLLFLSAWYPHDNDPQLGIFVKNHAECAASCSQVSVLTIRLSEEKSETRVVEKNNILEVQVYLKRPATFPATLMQYYSALRKGYSEIRKRRTRPDLVNLNILPLPFYQKLLINELRTVPYVITEHWSGYMNEKYNALNTLEKFVRKYSIRNSRFVLPVSDHLKKAMVARGLKGEYRILPNVIRKPGEKSPVRIQGKIAVLADLVDEIKNISGIIDAFNLAGDKIPHATLTIAGAGRDMEMLKRKAEASKYSDRISFSGLMHPDDVFNYLGSAEVVVVNSITESFSMVTAESFAAGTPVIATRCGGPEAIITNQTGILIDKQNPVQLADALIKIITSEITFDHEVMKKTAERYYPENVSNSYCEIIENAVNYER